MQVLECHDIQYFIVLLFFVNMADKHLRLIGVELQNQCVYIVTDFLVFIGEFKMRHNIISIIEGEIYHIFTHYKSRSIACKKEHAT